MMILARVESGRIALTSQLPPEWEGQTVKIEACTPDDEAPDLEQRLTALHALGPMEYQAGEQHAIERALAELNDLSRSHLQGLADDWQ